MRGFGILLMVVGVIAVLAALGMDTSVGTGLGGRVNNIGLMADRQNYTIIGGLMAIAGLLMVIFSGHKAQAGTVDTDTRPCPACAETIKNAAVKCKHCGEDVRSIQAPGLLHGWTVRVPSKPGAELERVEAIIAEVGLPTLLSDGATAIAGPFEEKEEARSAKKMLGIKCALHGEVSWMPPS